MESVGIHNYDGDVLMQFSMFGLTVAIPVETADLLCLSLCKCWKEITVHSH